MSAPTLSAPPVSSTARKAEAGLLLLVVIWALNFSVIKVGLATIPPHGFNALRFPLAAALLAAVLLAGGRLRLPERRDVARIVVLGVLGNFVYQLLFISGLGRSRAGNASVLLTTSPIYTALLSAWLGHERVRPLAWTGIAGTAVGMVLVVGSGESGFQFGTETLPGDLMLVTAAAVWSVYTVGARDLVRRYGSVAITAWTLWVGAVLLVLAGIPDLRSVEPGVPLEAWGAVVYAGVLGIGIAYLLWYRGVREIGNTRTAAIGNLVPVLAILIAWPMLGEVPNLWQVVGAAVILGGVSLVRRSTEVR